MKSSSYTRFFKPTQSTQDYFPFGSLLPGRGVDQGEYKFGFNSKEQDAEIYGDGNAYDFGARIYDPRMGRWMSCDPQFRNTPFLNPYNYCQNSPLLFNDPDGEDVDISIIKDEKSGKTTITITLTGVVSFDHLSTVTTQQGRERYVESLNNALEKQFSKSMANNTIETVFVSNMKLGCDADITESDHAVYVTNLQSGPNKVGNEKIGGFVNAIGGKKAYFPKALSFQAAVHEVGHWLGLAHPKDIASYVDYFAVSYSLGIEKYAQYKDWSYDKAYYTFSNDNVMHHPGDPGTPEQGGSGFDFIQTLMMNEALLNQGDNSWDFEGDKPGGDNSKENKTISEENIKRNADSMTKER